MGLGWRAELLEPSEKSMQARGVSEVPQWGGKGKVLAAEERMEARIRSQQWCSGCHHRFLQYCSQESGVLQRVRWRSVCLKEAEAFFGLWTLVQAPGFVFSLYAEIYDVSVRDFIYWKSLPPFWVVSNQVDGRPDSSGSVILVLGPTLLESTWYCVLVGKEGPSEEKKRQDRMIWGRCEGFKYLQDCPLEAELYHPWLLSLKLWECR